MNQVTTHQHDDLNKDIRIEWFDEPGVDGSNHEYILSLEQGNGQSATCATLCFHKIGDLEVVNGITDESLVAVLMHRMDAISKGPQSCEEAKMAFYRLQAAAKCMAGLRVKQAERAAAEAVAAGGG
jgi:hypothetical protein